MVRLLSRRGIVAIGVGLALVGSASIEQALAQSKMPMPPSANDPPPKATAPAAKKAARPADSKAAGPADRKAARQAAKNKATVSEPYGRSFPSYTDRIDTRPARGDLQLEDDPRVRPTMEGGRPGIGMKF